MIDIRIIRDNTALVEDALRRRHYPEDAHALLAKIIEMDVQWRSIKRKRRSCALNVTNWHRR